ncbi:MAG: PilN domain-containing protein [Thermoleophilia bacterium]|nr:PilN domain-containing protein [Thermoleophilia bacterium]
MRAVNLLPDRSGRASRGRRPTPSKKPLAILGAALAVAGLVYMAYSSRAALKDVQSEVAVATTERDGLQAQLSSLSAIDAQAAAITARRGAVVTLAGSRLNWERVMRDTVTVLPQNVWLTQMNAVAPPAETGAAGIPPGAATLTPETPPQGLHLEGFGFTQADVAQLLARLEAVPGLGTPRLESAEQIARGGKNVVQFIINVPIDQRAQDRPTLDLVTGATAATTTTTATPTAGSMTP